MISEATAQLIGVWSITEFKDRDDEASEWTSYGSDPHGIIIYDATGTISVHLVSEGPRPSATGYIGYWGRFRMIEAEPADDGFVGTLEHPHGRWFAARAVRGGREAAVLTPW